MRGIEATWLFKYATLKRFDAKPLSEADISFLELPDLDSALHGDIPEDIRNFRKDSSLHPFRHPGYPDDISVVCGPNSDLPDQSFEMSGKQVWVRITGCNSHNHLVGTMLNQPSFYDWKKGQAVGVHLINTGDNLFLVCGKV